MSIFESIMDRARGLNQRIVLSDGEDHRIVAGAVRAFNDGLAVPILLGSGRRIETLLKQFDASTDSIQIIDRAEGISTVSSFFLMLLERGHHGTS